MVRLASGIEHGRVYANVGGVTISDVTFGVVLGFAYVSVVFFIHNIYIRRRKQWCLRLTVYHFHTELLLFNYAEVKTVFHSMAPLSKVQACVPMCILSILNSM